MKFKLNLWMMIGLIVLISGCGAPTPLPQQPPTALPPTPAPTATLVPVQTTAPIATATSTVLPSPQVAAPTATVPQLAQGGAVTLTWYGHASFLLSTDAGFKALLDPTTDVTGYKIPKMKDIDVVTASHEHTDHNATDLADGDALVVLRGLGLTSWAKIDQMVKGVRVRTVGVFHDESQGASRGKNAIFIFEVAGLRLAHLGDLGHVLTAEQVKEIGPVDVILIPVGGYYTIDAKAAAEVVSQLQPRVIVPMHYKTPALAPSLASALAPVDDFIKVVGAQVVVVQAEHTLTLEKDKLPAKPTIMVMKYK